MPRKKYYKMYMLYTGILTKSGKKKKLHSYKYKFLLQNKLWFTYLMTINQQQKLIWHQMHYNRHYTARTWIQSCAHFSLVHIWPKMLVIHNTFLFPPFCTSSHLVFFTWDVSFWTEKAISTINCIMNHPGFCNSVLYTP